MIDDLALFLCDSGTRWLYGLGVCPTLPESHVSALSNMRH